jgi:catechol 2,3-dioxygenase-like lactoylglutathione lyase family enzyme
MQISSFYPVIGTDKVDITSAFYIKHFAFEATFESDWYVSLRSTSEKPYELAILDYSHPTMPEGYRKAVQGLLLNFEVEDVDAEYERLITQAGLPLVRELKSEAFGQRHFVTVDPSGTLVDIITNIPPSDEFMAQYANNSGEG